MADPTIQQTPPALIDALAGRWRRRNRYVAVSTTEIAFDRRRQPRIAVRCDDGEVLTVRAVRVLTNAIAFTTLTPSNGYVAKWRLAPGKRRGTLDLTIANDDMLVAKRMPHLPPGITRPSGSVRQVAPQRWPARRLAAPIVDRFVDLPDRPDRRRPCGRRLGCRRE